MKTHKEVCIHCCNQKARHSPEHYPWGEDDENRWEQDGAVYCFGIDRVTTINELPPPWCVYAAQHVVLKENL